MFPPSSTPCLLGECHLEGCTFHLEARPPTAPLLLYHVWHPKPRTCSALTLAPLAFFWLAMTMPAEKCDSKTWQLRGRAERRVVTSTQRSSPDAQRLSTTPKSPAGGLRGPSKQRGVLQEKPVLNWALNLTFGHRVISIQQQLMKIKELIQEHERKTIEGNIFETLGQDKALNIEEYSQCFSFFTWLSINDSQELHGLDQARIEEYS